MGKINPWDEMPLIFCGREWFCTSYYYRNGCFCDCLSGPQDYNGNNLHALQLRAKYMIDVLVEEYAIDKHIAELIICRYAEKTKLRENELNQLLNCESELETVIETISNRIKKIEEEINENISIKWLYTEF